MPFMKNNHPPDHFDCLSPREAQILRLFSGGRCGKEIAGDLGIQYHTVGTYKKRIMQKLQLKNHHHFLIAAIKHSLFQDDGDGHSGSVLRKLKKKNC